MATDDDRYWSDLAERVSAIQTERALAGDSYQQARATALRKALGGESPARLHKQVIDAEDAAGRAQRRADAAERQLHSLQSAMDTASLRRVFAVLDLVTQAGAPSRGGRHDEHCWTRHAACLGARIRDLLDRPAPTPRVITWDHREQPSWPELAEALTALTGGTVRLVLVDTGGAEYALVLGGPDLTEDTATAAYERHRRADP